jgi:hypothetical protein
MDPALLETLVEKHFRERTRDPEAQVWLEAEAAPLFGASIGRVLVDGTHKGYVLTDTELREGYRSSRTSPNPRAIREAIGTNPLFIYVEPDEIAQESFAGRFRAVASEPNNVLAGTRFHVPIVTRPTIARTSTNETNYIAVPEFTRKTPSEELIARAGIAATYVLVDPDGPMREITFERAVEPGALRYRS